MAPWLTAGRLWNELQRTRATLWVPDNYRKHYHHTSSDKKGQQRAKEGIDLKDCRPEISAWNSQLSEIVKQGSEMMASGNSKTQEGEQRNKKEGNEINKVTRPGRYSMMNNKPKNSTGRPATKFGCTGWGNQAHPLGGLRPARGKYWLRCGKSNNFTRVRPSRKPNHTGVQVRALGVGLDLSKSHPESWRSLVRGNRGKSQNPSVTLQLSKYCPCNITHRHASRR